MSDLSKISFREVHKTFAENVVVLTGLNLEVPSGEKLAIIGPSGSGKTTILRLLMGLDDPTGGEILLDGKPVWSEGKKLDDGQVSEARSKLGFVFQHFNLFPHMTALKNVAAGPIYTKGQKMDEALERANEMLDLVGLRDKANHYPSQLSGGQQQRVAIARAMAMDPEVMLFDEPTSALDPELVGDVLKVIADLAHRSNMTMLLVTHEMRFARTIADRVAFCDGGKVVEADTPERIFTDPQEERTRKFLDAVLNPI